MSKHMLPPGGTASPGGTFRYRNRPITDEGREDPYQARGKYKEPTRCAECGAVFHRWGHQASFNLDAMRLELEQHFVVAELRRTAFVSFTDRGIVGLLKSSARLLLAKFGQQIASPNILFLARPR